MLFSDNGSADIMKSEKKEPEESKVQNTKKQNYQKWVKKE